jgi:hypothetical protein
VLWRPTSLDLDPSHPATWIGGAWVIAAPTDIFFVSAARKPEESLRAARHGPYASPDGWPNTRVEDATLSPADGASSMELQLKRTLSTLSREYS